MAGVENIQQLMTEIGPLVDAIEWIEQEDEHHWAIGFDENLVMLVAFDAEARKVVFSVEIGCPPEEIQQQFYKALLASNAQWDESAGCRMAIDTPGGSVVQIFDLCQLDLDLSALAMAIQDLVARAKGWRTRIDDMVSSAAGADPISLESRP